MFFKKVKNSFKNVKKDFTGLRNSTNDWVLFLNSNQTDIKIKLRELDQRLKKLEEGLKLVVYR